MALSPVSTADLLFLKEKYDDSLLKMIRHVKDNPESVTGDRGVKVTDFQRPGPVPGPV
ncbi:hypothetical protein KIPB_009517, partial [Kipferlia bialata]|eukprot:g9517.t1